MGAMTVTILLWIAAAALVLTGLAGTLVPAIPGPLVVFCGLLLAAWVEGFQEVGLWTLAVLGVLTVISTLIDVIASGLGTRATGASVRAFWGAALGALVGIFFGLPGLILGPFAGAVIGELGAERGLHHATRAGYGAWLGLLVGTAVKLTLSFLMVGIFVLMRVV